MQQLQYRLLTGVGLGQHSRSGLLHDLGDAIAGAGCNIEVVMIATIAHKATDVFYVTHQGAKLGPEVEFETDYITGCCRVVRKVRHDGEAMLGNRQIRHTET